MNDKRKRTILSVVGMIVLLLVCAIGVQAVFAGLGMVSAQNGGVSSSQSAQTEGDGGQPAQEPGASSAPEDAGSAQPAPSFCPYCGEQVEA